MTRHDTVRAGEQATKVVVGVGARRGATVDEVVALVLAALDEAGLSPQSVTQLATVEAKAGEPGIVAAAARFGWPLLTHPADRLAAVDVPGPGTASLAALGTASVAEAAALVDTDTLVVSKRTSATATVAIGVARPDGRRRPAPHRRNHDPRDSTVTDSTVTNDTLDPATRADVDLRHHGDSEVGPGLVDLAVNVRAGTPPTWLRDVLVRSLEEVAAYPDSTTARAAVAARHGRPVEEVLLTAGAAEAFVLLARALRPRRPTVVHPQFTEPEAALRAAGHDVDRVLLPPPFHLDPALVPDDADLLVVGNPTNPTSVLHPARTLAALARPGRTILVDEAFADCVPGEAESLAGRRDLPGVVVVRSLTKTWGLAGLRVGYVLADASTVDRLAAVQPLWPVSAPALAAAAACVGERAVAEADAWARVLAGDRDYLAGLLRDVPGVDVVPESSASFLLVRIADAAAVRVALRERGFAVRRGDTFPGLGTDWLRLAVRDRRTSHEFVGALRDVLT
ncbi:Rv2231c family pyridoxal phosphate-dependent protein CobC [Actinopolymorpha pittospori]|uniref:Aminotransferase n=1 Tax=Actinopolymorpha pittospori TaxID=648752 RepID=A0A927MVZ9_9ACTN|nr:histidinol-phosphate aminotransferase [Actinopolymorpha pittospori]